MGSLIVAYGGEADKAKESVIAILCEEMAKFCKTEEDTLDMKAAKPTLRLTEWVLKKRLEDISNLKLKSKAIESTKKEIEDLIASLDIYISRI